MTELNQLSYFYSIRWFLVGNLAFLKDDIRMYNYFEEIIDAEDLYLAN